MRPPALKVFVVAEDRQLLRQMSKALGAFGYVVRQAAQRELAAAMLLCEQPDIMVVDSQPNLEAVLQFCASALGAIPPGQLHTLLLLKDPAPEEITAALEAGVDDFLSRPIVYGELLARLRAAARVLEFERRLRRQMGIDPLTKLPNRIAFHAQLERRLADHPIQPPPAACVVIDLDLLGRINRIYGRPAGDRVLGTVAQQLQRLCREGDLLGCLQAGRFAVLINEVSENEATDWVERVRGTLAECDLGLGEPLIPLTASFGMAACGRQVIRGEELLDRATRAMLAAKSSGRDCLVRYGEWDDDAEAWTQFAAPGKLFERTAARDIMTPCRLALRGDETAAEAAELFRRTRLDALPVVDERGKLVGLVFQQSVLAGPVRAEQGTLRISGVLTTDMPVYDEDTSFATLRDFFTRDSRSTIVVVAGDRPVGLVSPNNLAALSAPLTKESFACTGPYRDDSSYLMVTDLCPLDEVH